jgi:hypothetical protein
MTAAVIDLNTRRAAPQPAEPQIVATPGWGPCPLDWCTGCVGGDTHIAPGGARLVTDRIHTRTVEYLTAGDVEGYDVEVSVTLTAFEEHGVGICDTDIAVKIGDVAAVLDPAAADQLRAALGAAVALAGKPLAAARTSAGATA